MANCAICAQRLRSSVKSFCQLIFFHCRSRQHGKASGGEQVKLACTIFFDFLINEFACHAFMILLVPTEKMYIRKVSHTLWYLSLYDVHTSSAHALYATARLGWEVIRVCTAATENELHALATTLVVVPPGYWCTTRSDFKWEITGICDGITYTGTRRSQEFTLIGTLKPPIGWSKSGVLKQPLGWSKMWTLKQPLEWFKSGVLKQPLGWSWVHYICWVLRREENKRTRRENSSNQATDSTNSTRDFKAKSQYGTPEVADLRPVRRPRIPIYKERYCPVILNQTRTNLFWSWLLLWWRRC